MNDDDMLREDFLVQGALLRGIYRSLVSNEHNGQKPEGILAKLTDNAVSLNQFVDGARAKPGSPQALMLEDDAFEDLIALTWQIAWNLQNKQTLDINPLREQLKQLHDKLDEGF